MSVCTNHLVGDRVTFWRSGYWIKGIVKDIQQEDTAIEKWTIYLIEANGVIDRCVPEIVKKAVS